MEAPQTQKGAQLGEVLRIGGRMRSLKGGLRRRTLVDESGCSVRGITGVQVVDWLLVNALADSPEAALALGGDLLRHNVLVELHSGAVHGEMSRERHYCYSAIFQPIDDEQDDEPGDAASDSESGGGGKTSFLGVHRSDETQSHRRRPSASLKINLSRCHSSESMHESNTLATLLKEMTAADSTLDYRERKYLRCLAPSFSAADAITWLVSNKKASSRRRAKDMCNELLVHRLIEMIETNRLKFSKSKSNKFRDDDKAFYMLCSSSSTSSASTAVATTYTTTAIGDQRTKDDTTSTSGLIAQCKGFWIESCSPLSVAGCKLSSTEELKRDSPYKEYFDGKEHLNYIGLNSESQPVVISVREDSGQSVVLALVRTPHGDKFMRIPREDVKGGIKRAVSEKKLFAALSPRLVSHNLQKTRDPELPNDLKSIDNLKIEGIQSISRFKFGVLYVGPGQVNEDDMFNNLEGGANFEEFLEFLGERTELHKFAGYNGGLDVNHQADGKHCVYTKWDGGSQYGEVQIMFHVSTLLAHTPGVQQQLDRKRHIGNDVLVIVFKDGDTPFSPDAIASQLSHIYVVVSKDASSTESSTKYRVSIACKDGVPPFLPPLPPVATYEKGSYFRRLLFTKLIEGERSAVYSPHFVTILQRSRLAALLSINERYNPYDSTQRRKKLELLSVIESRQGKAEVIAALNQRKLSSNSRNESKGQSMQSSDGTSAQGEQYSI